MATLDTSSLEPRMRRHTMLPNPPATLPQESSPPRRTGYPSPTASERSTTGSGGVDIKKKRRAMSEATGESGSMVCETCGKGYKHASCLSKHRYMIPLAKPPPHFVSLTPVFPAFQD